LTRQNYGAFTPQTMICVRFLYTAHLIICEELNLYFSRKNAILR
jgi:hypothetical protein